MHHPSGLRWRERTFQSGLAPVISYAPAWQAHLSGTRLRVAFGRWDLARGFATMQAVRVADHLIELRVFSSQRGGTILVAMPVPDAAAGQRVPYAYQWIAATDLDPIPALVIVAAPSTTILDPDRLCAKNCRE